MKIRFSSFRSLKTAGKNGNNGHWDFLYRKLSPKRLVFYIFALKYE